MLNSGLSAVLAGMGHTDSLCIADAGLPVPEGITRIDLALRPGIPSFLDTLATVLEELVVERGIVAEEIRENNPQILEGLRNILGDVPIEFVSHEAFKQQTGRARAVTRTGECTPYANILLFSGVPF